MGNVLYRDENEFLLVYLPQPVYVLCLPVDGKGYVLVGMRDEDELLLVYLLQHMDDLCLPVDGEGECSCWG